MHFLDQELHRTFYSPARPVFTIAVTGPDPLLEAIAHHLEHPRYAPHLGRRNCPVARCLLLVVGDPGPLRLIRGGGHRSSLQR
ncbi:type I-E CRISPR-associated protein Cas5/CasD [Streptomyces sp. NPDC056628]|uniref:type I-E CRISPR-associated protein Cas5/CasD n=1 Tax=Streptomyces sp. NPDC056628 TaxID=3345882 RepID=UPI0036870A6D